MIKRKIKPSDLIKGLHKYTQKERKEIIGTFSIVEIKLLFIVFTKMWDEKKIELLCEKKDRKEIDEKLKKELLCSIDELRACCLGNYYYNVKDKYNGWNMYIDDIKRLGYEPECRMLSDPREINDMTSFGGSVLIKTFTAPYLAPLWLKKDILEPLDLLYNRTATNIYHIARLWIVMFQNLSNADAEGTLLSLKEGHTNEEIKYGNMSPLSDIRKLSDLFHGVNYLLDDCKKYPFGRRTPDEIGRYVNEMHLVSYLLKKCLICMEDAWDRNYEHYGKEHPEHWHETTAFFGMEFKKTCSRLRANIISTVSMIKEEKNYRRYKGYLGTMKANPAVSDNCSAHNINASKVLRLIQNPEEAKSLGIDERELNYYRACVGLGSDNKEEILEWFHKLDTYEFLEVGGPNFDMGDLYIPDDEGPCWGEGAEDEEEADQDSPNPPTKEVEL